MLILNISTLLVMCLTVQRGEGWLFSRRSDSGGSTGFASSSRSDSSDSSWSSGLSRRFSLGSSGSRLPGSNRMWSRNGFLNVEPGFTRNPFANDRNTFQEQPTLNARESSFRELEQLMGRFQRRDIEREEFRLRLEEIRDDISRHDHICGLCRAQEDQACINIHCNTVA